MLDSPLLGERAGLAARLSGQLVVGLPRDGEAGDETPVTVAEYRGLKELGMGNPTAFGGYGERLKIGFFRFVEDTLAAKGDVVNGTGSLFLRGDVLMLHIEVPGEDALEQAVKGVPVIAMRAPIQMEAGWDQDLGHEHALRDVLPEPAHLAVREAQRRKLPVRAAPLVWDRMYAGYMLTLGDRWRIDVTGPSAWVFPWELAPSLDKEATLAAIRERLDADEPSDVVEDFESRYLAGASAAARYRSYALALRGGGRVEKHCVACGQLGAHAVVAWKPRISPYVDGRTDDLEPPESCACGHVAPDVSARYRRYDADAEKALLALADHAPLARQCLAVARLFHGIDDDLEGRWVLRAAWANEAAGAAAELAGALRARAAPLLHAPHVVRAEVARTAGEFERALVHVQVGLLDDPDAVTKKVLSAVAFAIAQRDTAPLHNRVAIGSATPAGLVAGVLERLEPEPMAFLAERVRWSDAAVVRDTCAKVEAALERNPAHGFLVLRATAGVLDAGKDDQTTRGVVRALIEKAVGCIRGQPLEVGADEPGLVALIPKVMAPPTSGGAPLTPTASRMFAGEAIAGPPQGPVLVQPWGKRALGAVPPNDAIRRAVDADPRGIEEAEALAREVCRRCAPWGIDATPETVVWHMEAAPRVATYSNTNPFRAMFDRALSLVETRLTLGETEVVHDRHHPPPEGWKRDWRRFARHDLIRANAWRAAALRDARVPARVPVAAQGERYAALEDPLAPLMEIWALGYALAAVTPDAIVLAGAAFA